MVSLLQLLLVLRAALVLKLLTLYQMLDDDNFQPTGVFFKSKVPVFLDQACWQ